MGMRMLWFVCTLLPPVSTHWPFSHHTAFSSPLGGGVSQLQSPPYSHPLLLVIVEVVVVVLVEGTEATSNMSTTALYAVDYE
jgi:hypothetical protein